MEIREYKIWKSDAVRQVCIENNLYNKGNNEDYEDMLNLVKKLSPSTDNILFVAEDILENSEEQSLANIMFLLVNKAIITTYEIEE